ncbi:SdrD B-like domain-containing protein [Plantibacter elymi (nom. nud.)]|nr:SdrD B-like domain-containing protein [Plantibacter sp. VKM Ac-1784]
MSLLLSPPRAIAACTATAAAALIGFGAIVPASAATDPPPTHDTSSTSPEEPAVPDPEPEAPTAMTPDAGPLTLLAKLQRTVTGTAPFDDDAGPGRDISGEDLVVRSHDTVSYRIEVQVNGSPQGDAITISQSLPDGMTWPAVGSLPGYCGAGSAVSDDARTVDCVVHGVAPNSVSTYDLVASASTAMPDGTLLPAPTDAVRATAVDAGSGQTVSSSLTPDDLVMSSGPRLNLGVKRWNTDHVAVNPEGVMGYRVYFDAYLDLAGYNSAGGLGARGQSAIVGDVSFDIDLSDFSENAEAVDFAGQRCALNPYDRSALPNSTGGGVDGVTDSGTWTCTPDPSNPQLIHVVISGADLSADHLPTKSSAGVAIPTRGYVGIGKFAVFVPHEDVPADDSIDSVVTLRDLVAFGENAAGESIANPAEPLSDNAVTTRLTRRAGAGHSTRYLDNPSNLVMIPGQSSVGAGDGPVAAGQTFVAFTSITNTSTTAPMEGAIVCQVFDPKTQFVTTTAPTAPPVTVRASGAVGDFNPSQVIVEYGTGPVTAATADDETRWDDLSAATCDDADDTWTANWQSLDLSQVTRVRYRPVGGMLPAGSQFNAALSLQLRDALPVGETVTQTYSVKSPSFYGTDLDTPAYWTEDDWYHGKYNPVQSTNTDFPRGDRLLVSEGSVAIAKRAIAPAVDAGSPAHVASGERVQFELTPQIASKAGLVDSARDVVVVDRLPKGLAYDPADVSSTPDSVQVNEDGSTELTWSFDRIDRGSEPVISYWAKSDSTMVGDFVNQVIISSPDDPSSLDEIPTSPSMSDAHYSRQTVSLSTPGGLRIEKSVAQQAVESGDDIDYTVAFANMNADTPQQDASSIDVLPYAGDTRASSTEGELADAADAPSGVTVRYTDADPEAVSAATGVDGSADYGDLPAGSAWCTATEIGTDGCAASFADVTALRMDVDSLDTLERVEVTYTLVSTGAPSGATFVNDATVRSASQTLGARSPLVSTRVVSSSIGQRLWWDTNEDGLDNDGPDGAPGEGVADVPMRLSGVDKFGEEIEAETVTDSTGSYRFSGLVSGEYAIVVDVPANAGVTTFRVGDDDLLNSAVDTAAGVMEDITIVDPSPTGADAADLTRNGGLVAGAEPPVPPTDPPGIPEAEKPASGDLATTGTAWVFAGTVTAALLVAAGALLMLARRRRAEADAE